jgi:hypothetical protein
VFEWYWCSFLIELILVSAYSDDVSLQRAMLSTRKFSSSVVPLLNATIIFSLLEQKSMREKVKVEMLQLRGSSLK